MLGGVASSSATANTCPISPALTLKGTGAVISCPCGGTPAAPNCTTCIDGPSRSMKKVSSGWAPGSTGPSDGLMPEKPVTTASPGDRTAWPFAAVVSSTALSSSISIDVKRQSRNIKLIWHCASIVVLHMVRSSLALRQRPVPRLHVSRSNQRNVHVQTGRSTLLLPTLGQSAEDNSSSADPDEMIWWNEQTYFQMDVAHNGRST